MGLTVAKACHGVEPTIWEMMQEKQMHFTKYFFYCLTDNLSEITTVAYSGTPMVVNCLNPHSFVKALDNKAFGEALEHSDYLLPDGEGICMTYKYLKGKRLGKIAGDDLHRYLLGLLNKGGGRVYYLGSKAEVLNRIEQRLRKEYPSVEIATFSPSYGYQIPEDESERIIESINAFAPDVLFVGMTAPKQELWVEQYRSRLANTKIVANIGAVFDFYAGTVRRAPQWAIRMKIEWLVRLIKEPRRMWERNFKSTPRFLWWVFRHRKEC